MATGHSEDTQMRLDKYLAQAIGLSRKDIKRLLSKDRVEVNGQPTRQPAIKIALEDTVTLDGESVARPGPRYFMLHKPAGYVCAAEDPTHPTIDALFEDQPRADELHIAGRLDLDTTGLLLVTDDGQWSHRITSPRHKLPKRYYVETADPIEQQAIEAFAEGVMLRGEKKPTHPAQLEIVESHIAYLTITEGRYHQVKRMFAALGNKVVELHRDRIGPLELDSDLAEGDYRELTEQEIALI